MSQNFLRKCTLSLSGSKSATVQGGGPTDLRIVFAIKQWHLQSPNQGSFRIYNPSPSTVAAFTNKEFKTLSFSAGYEDNIGLIFQGDISQSISGHESAVDTYVDIFCGDGGNGYQQARVSKTLAAGYTPADKMKVATDAMASFGISLGINTLDLSQPKYPRGAPFAGMARDLIRQVALSAGGVWSIQNGKVMATPKSLDTGSQGGTVTLTAATGLVGWPQATQDGIRVVSLINPNLQPLQKIKLDPSQIIDAQRNNNPQSEAAVNANRQLDNLAITAGIYTIFHMDRSGDTRGGDWFDESLCIGKGGALPDSAVSAGYGGALPTLGPL